MSATTSPVAQLFRRGPTRSIRVGVEQELVARDVSGAAVAIDWIRAVARGSSYAPFLDFEPGGQVELSLPTAPDAHSAGADLLAAVTALRARRAFPPGRIAA